MKVQSIPHFPFHKQNPPKGSSFEVEICEFLNLLGLFQENIRQYINNSYGNESGNTYHLYMRVVKGHQNDVNYFKVLNNLHLGGHGSYGSPDTKLVLDTLL